MRSETNVEIVMIDVPVGVYVPSDFVPRLPEKKGRVKNLTGSEVGSVKVVGFVGYIGVFSAWLVNCKCGYLSVVRSNRFRRLAKADNRRCCHVVDLRIGYKKAVSQYRQWKKNEVLDSNWKLSDFLDHVLPAPSASHSLTYNGSIVTEETVVWVERKDKLRYSNRVFEIDGESGNLAFWARKAGITTERMRQRAILADDGDCSIREALLSPSGSTIKKSKMIGSVLFGCFTIISREWKGGLEVECKCGDRISATSITKIPEVARCNCCDDYKFARERLVSWWRQGRTEFEITISEAAIELAAKRPSKDYVMVVAGNSKASLENIAWVHFKDRRRYHGFLLQIDGEWGNARYWSEVFHVCVRAIVKELRTEDITTSQAIEKINRLADRSENF